MKFGQLIEFNIRNIFLEKSHKTCSWKASPKPLHQQNQKSLHQHSEILYSLF